MSSTADTIYQPGSYVYPSSATIIVEGGVEMEITFIKLSADSAYHFHSLLQYGEDCLLNMKHPHEDPAWVDDDSTSDAPNDSFELDREDNNKAKVTEPSFSRFKKMLNTVPEAFTEAALKLDHPKRIVLSGTSTSAACDFHQVPARSFCHGNQKIPINLLYHTCRLLRGEMDRYGYMNVRMGANDNVGRVLNARCDLIYIDYQCSKHWTASVLFEAFKDSKIKSIAVHTSHPDFVDLMKSFSKYPHLELVLLALGDGGGNRDGVRRRHWEEASNSTSTRLSRPDEVLFEVIDPNNPYPAHYFVPTAKEGRHIGYRDPKLPPVLIAQMARKEGNGKWVCPTARFVRVIKYCDTL
ncbi:hypothetical protein G7Y89_g15681 [Cudoniella acicularis]|uniref:Uncharacterized protein n=1 Tax=Cudoniella acicularis TaxID=354080 RepID=A0A8H4QJ70_9HELO|nr:hypothetical protein G7Y89_g15681 [Cudoniella acicularis]